MTMMMMMTSDGPMVTSKDKALLFLPFFHVYGQVVTLITPLVCRRHRGGGGDDDDDGGGDGEGGGEGSGDYDDE